MSPLTFTVWDPNLQGQGLAKEALGGHSDCKNRAFMGKCSHKRDSWKLSHPVSKCEDLKEADGI